MSRPRNYWYSIVKKMVYRYPDLNTENPQEKMYLDAIKGEILQTLRSENGTDKLKAIEVVCFEKSMSIQETSQKMFYGDRTIKRWISDFINRVGKRVGF